MTFTATVLKSVWSNAKMPCIRVAVPALRCPGLSARKAKKVDRQVELERMFRDDLAAHLPPMNAGPRLGTKPESVPQQFKAFPAAQMTRAIRQAA